MNVDDIASHVDGPGDVPHVVATVDKPLSKHVGSHRSKAIEALFFIPGRLLKHLINRVFELLHDRLVAREEADLAFGRTQSHGVMLVGGCLHSQVDFGLLLLGTDCLGLASF